MDEEKKKCDYCGSMRPAPEMKQRSVVSYFKWALGYSPPRNYCKDKPCHEWDQMGHEG